MKIVVAAHLSNILKKEAVQQYFQTVRLGKMVSKELHKVSEEIENVLDGATECALHEQVLY